MKLIGVNGFKQSGKGTVGQMIKISRANVHCVGFADQLKVLAARTLGIQESDAFLIDLMDEAKLHWSFAVATQTLNPLGERAFTGREYLQWLGTGAREVFGRDFWVDQVIPHDLSGLWHGVDILVITDLRFKNEAERVLEHGGEVWEVQRPGTDSDGHISERPLPAHLITQRLMNNCGLAELEGTVRAALAFAERREAAR